MKTNKQKNSQINHKQTPKNHTNLPTKPPTPIPLTKIIPLHPMRLNLHLNQQHRQNQLRIHLPVIGEENLNIQSPQPVKHQFSVWALRFPHSQSTSSLVVRQYAFHTQTLFFLIVKNATSHQAQL
jgi:hypothetical protein